MRIRAAALVLLAAACGQPEPAAEADLLGADSAFARATAAEGAAGWTSWFDTAGTMVRAAGEIRGHADIRAAMEPALGDSTIVFTWSPERAIVGSGDLGATIGSYEITAADGGAVLDHGRYLTVWKRQADGSWKVIADIGSPAQQAAAAAPPPDGS